MQNSLSKKRYLAPALLTAGLLLSACSSGQAQYTEEDATQFVYDNTVGLVEKTFLTGNWRQIQAASHLRTQSVVQAHAVNFQPGAASFSEAERGRLMEFLRAKGIRREDRVQLDGLRSETGQHLPGTEQRIEALRLELANLGIRAHVAQAPITIHGPNDERIAVVVTRTLVALPDCSAVQPARGKRPQHVRDCANQSALGMMVANPADLQQGSPGGPADGAASVLSIERYRAGEVTPLDDVLSTKEVEQE